jgi:hypothetical protein
MLFNNEFLAV